MADIGLKVYDKPAEDTPFIEAAEFTTLGGIGRSSRGKVGAAIRLGSPVSATKSLGNPVIGMNGVLQVIRGYNNAVPYSYTTQYIRVVGPDTAAATGAMDCGRTKVILVPSSVTITVSAFTIAAVSGTNKWTITIVGTVNAVAKNESYVVTTDEAADAINFGVGAYTASEMIRFDYIGDELIAVASTAITGSGLVIGSNTSQDLVAANLGFEDPGSWGNDYGHTISVFNGDPTQRSVTIWRKISGVWESQQTIEGITRYNLKSKLERECSYAMLDAAITTSPFKLPEPVSSVVQWSGGADESSAPDVDDYISALQYFNGVNVQQITLFENLSIDDTKKFAAALDLYMETSHPTALGAVAVDATTDQLTTAGWSSLLRKKSFISSYMGYEYISDGFGGTKKVPAFPAVYGRGYIKKMFDDDSKLPWVAPGGYETALLGTELCTTEDLDDPTLKYLVKTLGVNPIMKIDRVGWVARTSRTMSTDNRQYDIHKRRSVNFIADSFKISLGWVEQAANTPETWRKLVDAQRVFLLELYNKKMFHKEYGFDGAVQLKTDTENNPTAQVAQRILVSSVKVWIVDTVESAEIILKSVDNGPLNVTVQ